MKRKRRAGFSLPLPWAGGVRDRLKPALRLALAALVLVACEREERRFREMPSAAARRNSERLTTLVPGPYTPDVRVENPYGWNAYAVAEGQRLFSWYNCVGCHAHGGGGMGPPLMDERWRYGSDPEQIFATIVEGRPNGMPSFRGKIPEYQVWQLVAYVQAMSGHVLKDAAGGRPDAMHGRKQNQALPDLVPEREPAPVP